MSQAAWITRIMIASVAVLSAASATGEAGASVDPANTAPMASHAFGLAIASARPPAKDGAAAPPLSAARGGAVAMRKAR